MGGRWLCAAILAGIVAASVPDAAQAFTCQDREFVLDSLANGRAVTAELNYQDAAAGMLRARATAHDAWERYRMVCLDGGQFAIVALNTGRYVSTETGYAGNDQGMLRARATEIGPTERYVFEQTTQEGDFVRGSMKSVANNRYVTVELGAETTDARYGMLRARAAISDRWEQLELAWQPLPPVAGPVDADGDGFFVGQDCDDANPAIRPGAPEVRGNGVDENCDGRDDELLRIGAGVSSQFHVVGTHFTIRKLRATRGARRRDRRVPLHRQALPRQAPEGRKPAQRRREPARQARQAPRPVPVRADAGGLDHRTRPDRQGRALSPAQGHARPPPTLRPPGVVAPAALRRLILDATT